MFSNFQMQNLWDHKPVRNIFSCSFDMQRQFIINIRTQVLKLASRFANQNSKEEVTCLLIGSCVNNGSVIKIEVDRIECNLASYLSHNELLCSDDIGIPLKIFKKKSTASYAGQDYVTSLNEYFKEFQDIGLPVLISKTLFLKAYAGSCIDKTQKSKATLTTLSWIDLKLLVPELHLTLSPLNKLPIFRSALISSFENQCDKSFTFGYLSMDQSGKVQFLLHSDERVMSAALVGIWVHGVHDVSDILVISACTKYILSESHNHNKVCKPPFPFLLAQFTDDIKDSLRFFDVKWPKGPSDQDHSSPSKHVSFNLFSGIESLDKYYQSPNEKCSTFEVTLTKSCPGKPIFETIFEALQRYIPPSRHQDSLINDDTVPRLHNNTIQPIMGDNVQGLEVSDVSLLINDVSVISTMTCSDKQPQYDAYISQLVASACPGETKSSCSSKSSRDFTPMTSSKTNEDANPRPMLRKQHLTSSRVPQTLVQEVCQPQYQPIQFIPQPMFPYPAIYPANPYMMYPPPAVPPQIYIQDQDRNPTVVSKPPPRPKKMNSKSKPTKVKGDQGSCNVVPTKGKTIKGPGTRDVNRAVITDVTNTSSKRVLQLDREEDLATLDMLVQQIINQRDQMIPTMVSTGVNTSQVFSRDPRSTKQYLDTSTDVQSFTINPLCARCQRSLYCDDEGEKVEEVYREEVNSFSERDEKENEFGVPGSEIEPAYFNVVPEGLDDLDDLEERDEHDKGQESMHYSELLNNLDELLKQSRKSVVRNPQDDSSDQLLNITGDDQFKINLLEEAVQNLRDLDLNQDLEGRYWETVQNSSSTQKDIVTRDEDVCDSRDSVDATILQQKIHYVSMLLDQSMLSPGAPGSDADNRGVSSLSEQSLFIDSLARKYLHRATSDLERISVRSTCPGSRDARYLGEVSRYQGTVTDASVSTRKYLEKYNLVMDQDPERESDLYYSSIRKEDDSDLPRQRWAISSTPAPHYTHISAACKKTKVPLICPCPGAGPGGIAPDTWSGIRILEGLAQQPSILPPPPTLIKDPESGHACIPRDFCTSAASSDMVLDLEKLRLLPKYL